MNLGALVGVPGQVEFLGVGIDEIMTLRRAADVIREMQARIEPLR